MVVERLGMHPSQSKIDAVAQLISGGGESPARYDWLFKEVRPPIQRRSSANLESSSGQALAVETGEEVQGAMG